MQDPLISIIYILYGEIEQVNDGSKSVNTERRNDPFPLSLYSWLIWLYQVKPSLQTNTSGASRSIKCLEEILAVNLFTALSVQRTRNR